MTKKTRKWLLALIILVFPFVLFCAFLIFMEEPLPPLAPVPNPNGYNDLVKAGKMVAPDTGDLNKTNEAQVREIVSANAAALALARAGLSNQCRVPVQYTAAFNSNHLNDLAALKRLVRAFVAEGNLAESENRPADAVKSYVDAARLGVEGTRGGLIIDKLVAIAIEAIGASQLQTLAPQLDSKTCREIADALAALDSQRQTWDEVMQQESAWSHGTFPGLRNDVVRWMERKSMNAAIASTKHKLDAQEQRTRQLILEFAARAYELDKGKPPASAADLVPDYLKAVPQDPVTGTNMVYFPR